MKKIKKRTKIILGVLSFILVTCVTLVVVVYKYMNRLNVVPLNVGTATTEKEIKEELNISEETEKKSLEHNVENILILGVDNDENASDAGTDEVGNHYRSPNSYGRDDHVDSKYEDGYNKNRSHKNKKKKNKHKKHNVIPMDSEY